MPKHASSRQSRHVIQTCSGLQGGKPVDARRVPLQQRVDATIAEVAAGRLHKIKSTELCHPSSLHCLSSPDAIKQYNWPLVLCKVLLAYCGLWSDC